MVLTFEKNKFILTKANGAQVVTTNIKEAARFRLHADCKAEKIFNKLMLKALPFPAGGLLVPKGLELLPFQNDLGVPFILTHNRSYLAHQPGLGKTAQAVVAASSGKPNAKTLVIMPSFLKTTWAREITKWSHRDFPTIRIVPESIQQPTMNWGAEFILVSDAMLTKSWVLTALSKIKFDFLFIDEAHRFKNPLAARTVALFGGRTERGTALPGLIYNIERVSALSGTPMLNKAIELWPILYAMAPETIDFMSYQNFGFKYGDAFQDERGRWHFTGSANEDDLKKKIMGTLMQRITKADVLKDLPDKVREVVVVTKDTRSKDIVAMDRDACKYFGKGTFEVPESLGTYAIIRHETGLSKVAWVSKMVAEILFDDENESIILFAHHRDVVQKLAQELIWYKPRIVQGGISPIVRTEIEDEFQSGKCRLIVGNIDAMNLGLTLTKATRVVFAEYAWTPALNEQAEDRAHRIGQKDSVFVQYVVLAGSMDEKILEVLLKKQTSIEKVIG